MNLFWEWFRALLYGIAGFGFVLGFFSALWPAQSIRLNQFMMKCFNWRVEPIDYEREVKITRRFGWLIVLLCVFLTTALINPKWFLPAG